MQALGLCAMSRAHGLTRRPSAMLKCNDLQMLSALCTRHPRHLRPSPSQQGGLLSSHRGFYTTSAFSLRCPWQWLRRKSKLFGCPGVKLGILYPKLLCGHELSDIKVCYAC